MKVSIKASFFKGVEDGNYIEALYANSFACPLVQAMMEAKLLIDSCSPWIVYLGSTPIYRITNGYTLKHFEDDFKRARYHAFKDMVLREVELTPYQKVEYEDL